jgi:hypothetical protein
MAGLARLIEVRLFPRPLTRRSPLLKQGRSSGLNAGLTINIRREYLKLLRNSPVVFAILQLGSQISGRIGGAGV